ncbi:hypothetical protein Psesu_0322 [Pseudoxanthomonas suwonensis 11-1]|uniref:Uncharacterized protein n=1 Tax=Pseudoxanthomonas suwonensis (strain 11-1) TaxID=743721 RepID=E6WQ06_PSEUU|nr:hypothetical protein Psesu_0322 [Pseudoxanthomonas suwonensis 11-1]
MCVGGSGRSRGSAWAWRIARLRHPWLQRATAAHPCAACTMPPRRQGFASVGSGLAFLPALPSGRGAGGRGEGLRLRAVRCCRYPGDCCNCNRECGLDWLRKEPRQHGGMSHRAAPPSTAPTRGRSTSLCCLRHAPVLLPRLRERWERPRLPVSLSLPGEARACAPLARYRRTSARRARSAAGWGLRLAVTSSRYPGPLQLQPGVGARPAPEGAAQRGAWHVARLRHPWLQRATACIHGLTCAMPGATTAPRHWAASLSARFPSPGAEWPRSPDKRSASGDRAWQVTTHCLRAAADAAFGLVRARFAAPR